MAKEQVKTAEQAEQPAEQAAEQPPEKAQPAPGGHNAQNRRITAILRASRGANASMLGALRRLRHENASLRSELAGK